MDQKRRVLIIESDQLWQLTLQQAFPSDQFDVKLAQAPDEAFRALQHPIFDLIVVDPDYTQDDQIKVLADIAKACPSSPLVVVSATPIRLDGVLTNVTLVSKEQWDSAAFSESIARLLAGQSWGPPAPEITLPIESEEADIRVIEHRRASTRMFSITGLTGPLPTGLTPPPIGSRLGKPRVLIVEDNTEWQHTFAQIMETEEYFWRVAPNYEHAVERLRLESFHVVLLDLAIGEADGVMREGKGWQLLDYLVVNCPKTKVLAASGNISRADVAKLFTRYPIKGFIDKDVFNDDELRTIIREQIAGPRLRIQTLGNFRVWRDGKSITDFGDNKAEDVIKILLTRRGENVSVEELVGFLWPGPDPKTAYSDLNISVNSARLALEPDLPRPNDSNFITRNGASYNFNFLANLELDAEQLRLLVSEARYHDRQGDIADALQDYETARTIYQGDYLPTDRSAPWAIQERSTLQGLYTGALNRIADLYAEMDKLDLAIEAASRSLQVDAYSESTYRRLMRYYSCKGDQKNAKDIYRNLVTLFSQFFGEEPTAITTRLYEDIMAGREVVCVEEVSVSGEWRIAND
jgi:DNA-binding SARP family transcriptional activator/ActR/RegA family two-component response regulator